MNSAKAAPHQMQTFLQHTSKGLDLLTHPVTAFHLDGTAVSSLGVQHRDDGICCRDIWLSLENVKSYLQVLTYQGDVASGSGQLLCSHSH